MYCYFFVILLCSIACSDPHSCCDLLQYNDPKLCLRGLFQNTDSFLQLDCIVIIHIIFPYFGLFCGPVIIPCGVNDPHLLCDPLHYFSTKILNSLHL